MNFTKTVREALTLTGVESTQKIYNDRSKKMRRLKIEGLIMTPAQEMRFRNQLLMAFGDDFITAQHLVKSQVWGVTRPGMSSMCVYLKD